MQLKRHFDRTKDKSCEACQGTGVVGGSATLSYLSSFLGQLSSAKVVLRASAQEDITRAALICPECNGRKVKMTVSHVEIQRMKDVQNFSPRVLAKAEGEGWLTKTPTHVELKTADGIVKLKINRTPGLYCCHCNKPQDDSGAAALHVKYVHEGVTSPDPANPSGYRRDNYYACEVE